MIDPLKRFQAQIKESYPDLSEITSVEGFNDWFENMNGVQREAFATSALQVVAELSQSDLLFEGGAGLPQLNPLVQGAIIERLQFDGDIPELRSGPLPDGVKPALSVQTSATNLAMIGALLVMASDEMAEEIQCYLESKTKELEESGSTDLVKWEIPDHPGYKRGELPKPVKANLKKPLVAMSSQEIADFTTKALMTTQGRRSCAFAISDALRTRILQHGVAVEICEKPLDDEAVLDAQWVFSMEGDINPNFPYITIANNALFSKIKNRLSPVSSYKMVVRSVDDIPNRVVGWECLLWKV